MQAREIYQSFIDFAARALWDRRYEELAARLHYPHVIASQDSEVTVDTPACSVDLARSFRDNLSALRADAYHRVCLDAAFAGEDRIVGRHRNFVLRGALQLLPAYEGHLILLRDGQGDWLGAGNRSFIRNADIQIHHTRDHCVANPDQSAR